MRLFSIINTVAMVSIPPEAPIKWPVMDLVELMATLSAQSPRALLMAMVSIGSFSDVEVPWALI